MKYPVKDRSCTDCLMAMIFLLSLILVAGTGVYGVLKGNPSNIVQPYDSSSNACGRDKAKAYPYLYLTTANPATWGKKNVCVKECPQQDGVKLDCLPNKEVTACSQIKAINTFFFANRYCIPQSDFVSDKSMAAFKALKYEKLYADATNSWRVLLISAGIAIIISFMYVLLLEFCGAVILYLVMLGFLVAMTFLGWYFYSSSKMIGEGKAQNSDDSNLYLYLAYGVWGIEAVFLCCMICLCSQIDLATDIVEMTADYITDVMRVIFVPLISLTLLGAYLYWAIYSGAMFFSIGEIHHEKGDIWGSIKWPVYFEYIFYAWAFAFLWHIAYLNNLNMFLLTMIACVWYFDDDGKLNYPLTKALSWAFIYHVGTIAWGSFLLAVIWSIQIVLAYIHKKYKEAEAIQNKALDWAMGCLQCCAQCFERLIKYISRHAYVECILKNVGFCKGSQLAFTAVTSNVLRFSILTGILHLTMIFGNIAIACSVTAIGYFLLQYEAKLSKVVFETFGPLIIVFVIAYTISNIFMNIFDVSADALLHCYVVDESDDGVAGPRNKIGDTLARVDKKAKANGYIELTNK